MESVRLAAARALLAFEETGTLQESPPANLMREEDRGLYLQLVRGVVRHRRLLEVRVEQLAAKPLHKLDRELVWAALLGLFQLYFLERIPPHAAVFETVALAMPLGRVRGKGWLNAILRTALREQEREGGTALREQEREGSTALREQEREGSTAMEDGGTSQEPGVLESSGRGLAAIHHPWAEKLPLAARTSFPDWMVARWEAAYGPEETERLCRVSNHPGGVTLRVEPSRSNPVDLRAQLAAEGVVASPHPLWPASLVVERPRAALQSSAFSEGLCYAQDVSSQLLMAWCEPLFEGRVLDVCAAPGGKLTWLAGRQKPGLSLVALEPSAGRLHRIRENLTRLQLAAVPLLRAVGQRLPFGDQTGMDGVLLDVPCTATGIIRKYPELKWRRTLDDVQQAARQQGELLDEAARVVRPGGWILYITCSLEPEENQQAVAAFLARQKGFTLRSFRDLPPPEGLGEPWQGFITEAGAFFCAPGEDRTGLFATILQRAAGETMVQNQGQV